MIVRKFLSRVARKVAAVSSWASRALYQTPDETRKAIWFRDGAEATLRLDYDLTAESIVFDVGGYEGHWASDLFSKYLCNIHVFEPVRAFDAKISERFARNPKIVCHPFGLAGETKKLTITVDAYASSVFKGVGQSEEIELVDIAQFVEQSSIRKIDLLKVNIEGGEYELLDRLITTGLIERVVDLQVQFHDFVPDAESRMKALQERVSVTHETTYQYPFVWENWRRKTALVAPDVAIATASSAA